ncbi:MAG: hypothetical protein KF691_12140 [Phycisphaeraceae bacterium]|nr:hypothetical protein [Phycisphaeraceae bacterium]
MKTVRNIVAMTGAIAVCCAANAGFFADFETYAPNQRLQGVDGWKGWNNASTVAGLVSSSMAYDSDRSLRISGTAQSSTDAVHEFSGATSGVWTVSAMQYLGANQKGSTYFILMNKYNENANNNNAFWSTQLRFDLSAGRVYDDFRGGSASIVTNQWVSIRVDIDLTNNTVKHYYNDILISSGTWTTGSASKKAIASINLYTGAKNDAYYDDISIGSSSEFSASRIPAQGSIATMAVAGLCMMPRRRRR